MRSFSLALLILFAAQAVIARPNVICLYEKKVDAWKAKTGFTYVIDDDGTWGLGSAPFGFHSKAPGEGICSRVTGTSRDGRTIIEQVRFYFEGDDDGAGIHFDSCTYPGTRAHRIMSRETVLKSPGEHATLSVTMGSREYQMFNYLPTDEELSRWTTTTDTAMIQTKLRCLSLLPGSQE